MSNATFIDRLCAATLSCDGGNIQARGLIGRAIADTLAVAAVGFVEPVVKHVVAAYGGGAATTWSGARVESREAAIFVNGIAAHALDFDDVFLDSAMHPSVVILPAILEMDRPVDPDELIAAYGAGLIAARAIARFVGQGHYHKGWHATGTYGVFAATAAAARLVRLDERRLKAAFGLAASQSAGMKQNFGTMAKPAHAGFAASAAMRAVRLAAAGVDASEDIFGGKGGFASLYGTGDGSVEPDDDAFALRPDLLSVKLYPCCYAAHRLIGVGLDARKILDISAIDARTTAVLEVPSGSLLLLENENPHTGLEAKFSAKYAITTALFDGEAGLSKFTDDATRRPGLADALRRVEIVEDPAQQSGNNIHTGRVTLAVFDGEGRELGRFVRSTLPGSPDSPPTRDEFASKLTECFAAFALIHRDAFPALSSVADVGEVVAWLPISDPAGALAPVAAQAN